MLLEVLANAEGAPVAGQDDAADRGVVREGAVADLMVFDPAELDCLDKEPSPNDLPGGEARWVQRARGIRYVFVNGEPTIWDGQETGALPGKVLRSGWYR